MPIKPVKKISFILLAVLLCVILCGCWNYRQLNTISIVMGMAIDKDTNNNYLINYEIMNLSQSSDTGQKKSILVESTGKTIFEAIRNGKTKIADKLYLGNMEILILSNQIASEEGILSVLDVFFRDAEPRETLKVAISQEETAKEILHTKGISNGIASMDIMEIIASNSKTTSTSIDMEMYKIYNNIKSNGLSLVLPAVHCVENDTAATIANQEKIAEINGTAIFKDDKLIGYLSQQETFYFLFVVDEIKGGPISMAINNSTTPNLSLEISKNKTEKSHTNENGKIKIKLKIDTYVNLNELTTDFDISSPEGIKQIETEAEKVLTKGIRNTIKKVQTQFNSDIFGFGNMIYKKDYKLWQKINQDWDNIFPTLTVEIETTVNIRNTAFIKTSQ